MKTKILYHLLMFALLANSLNGKGKSPIKLSDHYNKTYDQLVELEADPEKSAIIKDIAIFRDACSFILSEGELYLCKPINNKVRAAIFFGKGSFTMVAPNDIETGQIKRTFGDDKIKIEFSSLVLIFTDSTYEEFTSKLSFQYKKVTRDVNEYIKKMMRYQCSIDGKNVEANLMKSLLEENHYGFFSAYISKKYETTYMYKIDPYDDEEISFNRCVSDYTTEPITQFSSSQKSEAIVKNKKPFIGEKYFVNSKIDNSLNFSAQSTIVFRTQQNNHKWMLFELSEKLVVDSVCYKDGTRLDYFKEEENPCLWIRLPYNSQVGKRDTLSVFYHGDIIEKNMGITAIKSSMSWFPYCEAMDGKIREKAFYDLRFIYPQQYTLTAVGKCKSFIVDNDMIKSNYVVDEPIRNASFYIGKFKTSRFVKDSVPPVTILSSNQISYEFEKEVGFDVQNSIMFYKSVFGGCPIDSICAVDVPFTYGLAFPGFIQLSTLTFRKNRDVVDETSFRAHEVAHQWWGISVEFDSYHDQWLSEGFSEYSSLWYTQIAIQNNKKFFDVLKEYRDDIIQARNYIFHKGQQMGPICLGYRNETSETDGDYYRIVYKKSAWVLHMLRNMMIDLKTMNEDSFISLMKFFYNKYKGKIVTTNDFKDLLEKVFQTDMSWFFNQWIYGVEIPKYKFAYNVTELSEQQYKVHCKVQVENVSNNFKMPVPILLVFDDEQFARVRTMIVGNSCEFDLPILPMKPNKILFNDLESVLCEVEQED